jgi:hypothetical protein
LSKEYDLIGALFVARILTSAKRPALNFPVNPYRKNRSQKRQFRDRDLRRKVFHISLKGWRLSRAFAVDRGWQRPMPASDPTSSA